MKSDKSASALNSTIAYSLLLVTCFQFLAASVGLQSSPLYFILNPYVVLAPFFIVWLAALAFYRSALDKNLLVLCLLMALIQVLVVSAFLRSGDFPFNYLRSIQFFWGPVLLTPMMLGFFHMASVSIDLQQTARRYIKALSVTASLVTFLEVFLVLVVKIPSGRIPWVSTPYPQFRPFGLADYPQPNAVMLALLFWLSILYHVKGRGHRILTIAALALTFGGTGQITFLALAPLLSKRPFRHLGGAAILVGIVVGYATITSQWRTDGPLGKLDLAYSVRLISFFLGVLRFYLVRFTTNNLLLGSPVVDAQASVGLTHDWAYFDVFYVSGLLGVIGYLLLYGGVIFLSCPRERNLSSKLYFVLIVLAANFHYGTLNYYIGQAMFSILAALNIYRRVFSRRQSTTAETLVAT